MKNIGRILAPMLAAGLFATIPGCREDAESPTAPEVTSALSAASAPLSFRQVSAGAYHTCGVTFDNRAYCWGEAALGALGNGDRGGFLQTRPVPVQTNLRFILVSAGTSYACGLTTQNRAYCWGSNSRGQLGDGSLTDRLTPVAVVGP